MQTVTGHELYDAEGRKVGQIVDLLGLYSGAEDVGWLAVKLSWRTTRLVPDIGLETEGDAFRVPLTKDQISRAPKVPPHFEPAGDDREALLSHYGVRLAGL